MYLACRGRLLYTLSVECVLGWTIMWNAAVKFSDCIMLLWEKIPDSPHFSVLQATESRAGPGNEANSHSPYSISAHIGPIRLTAPIIVLYAPSLSSPLLSSPLPVQVPTGYWSLGRFIRPYCHHCCPRSLLLLLLLLLVAIATYSDINNGKPVLHYTLLT